MREFVAMTVLALAVSVAACGQSDSKSPLTPSASPPSDGSLTGSAIISGTVQPVNDVELKGTISLLVSTCPSVTFTVSSTTVATNAATQFDETACTALHDGDAVEVNGTKQTDGSVLASKVEKEKEEQNEEQNEVKIKGTVSGAVSGHACPAFTFTVGSKSVTTSASTNFKDTTCVGVVDGISVEVKGASISLTAIAANEVEKE